jgi:hypothetical protein
VQYLLKTGDKGKSRDQDLMAISPSPKKLWREDGTDQCPSCHAPHLEHDP